MKIQNKIREFSIPENKLTIADLFVYLVAVLLPFAVLFTSSVLFPKESPEQIEVIYENGHDFYSLDKDLSFGVESRGYVYVIEIFDGNVYVKSSNCPDKTCTNMKAVGKKSGSIVCIPGGLIIKTADERGADDEADIVIP